jgi:hypothetical protein
VSSDRQVGNFAFTRQGGQPSEDGTPNGTALSPVTRRPSPITHAFTLVEILVVVVLLSFIILALMSVFNATQIAFRAGITQTDVMEGGRGVMGLMKTDFESMAPSFGPSSVDSNGNFYTFIPNPSPVNFTVNTNFWQYQSNAPALVQTLIGSTGSQRTNVLDYFFILSRQNTTWTGVGYFVDTASTNYFNPLYRFSISTNMMARNARNIPAVLYANFLSSIAAQPIPSNPTNLSHLMDGVMHLTVHASDPNGRRMTNFITTYILGGTNNYTTNRNVWFSLPALGEVGFNMYSNTLPAAVEVEVGVLEDRAIQRAESLFDDPKATPAIWTRSNYLAQQAGKVHLFRQRFPIRNVDPTAYQ